MRIISLNGNWKCKPDIDDIGITKDWHLPDNYSDNDKDLIDIEIPSSFNLLNNFENFEGIFWHYYQFNYNDLIDTDNYTYIIRVKGSNYNTKIWLNRTFLGENDGGFLPFSFNLKKSLKKGENVVVIRTENLRKKERIPSIYFDWFNWGGIYRDVDLLVLNRNRIKDLKIKTTLISKVKFKIEIYFKVNGILTLKWQIFDTNFRTILYQGEFFQIKGMQKISLIIDNPKLWSPENPELYYIKMLSKSSVNNNSLLFETYFGIRQIEIKNTQIYLNKKRLKLRGISLHEEYMPYGRTIPYEKRLEDIKTIKSLGFNALRTAHYSHDEILLEIADKVGLLILEEIPLYWNCDYKSNETFKLAAKMLRDLIKRDINHPSVIWWSVGNEIPIHRRECSIFVKRLMYLARKYDNTRIITYVSRKLIADLTRRYADVATINTYFGWYYGHERILSLFLDIMRTPLFNKPWIFTEFGAGAKYGYHDDWKNQTKFTEERQLQILDYTIRTINSKNYFSGWFIWIFRDFRSIIKYNKYQQGFNRKGIVSEKSHEKKLIYYRIPQILGKCRDTINTRILGLFLWILFFPFSYLILTPLITLFSDLHEKLGFKKGIKSFNYSNK